MNPLTWSWYEKTTLTQMKQMRFKTTRVLRSGMCIIPAEALCVIDDKRSGVTILTEKCTTCGVQGVMSKVSPSDIELVKEEACS